MDETTGIAKRRKDVKETELRVSVGGDRIDVKDSTRTSFPAVGPDCADHIRMNVFVYTNSQSVHLFASNPRGGAKGGSRHELSEYQIKSPDLIIGYKQQNQYVV